MSAGEVRMNVQNAAAGDASSATTVAATLDGDGAEARDTRKTKRKRDTRARTRRARAKAAEDLSALTPKGSAAVAIVRAAREQGGQAKSYAYTNTLAYNKQQEAYNDASLSEEAIAAIRGIPHQNVPVFLIQCHGDHELKVRYDGRNKTVGWAQASPDRGPPEPSILKVAGSNSLETDGPGMQWVIQTAPAGTTAVCSPAEDAFAASVGNNLKDWRDRVMSHDVLDLFKIRDTDLQRVPRLRSSFTPPSGIYFDKQHQPWDDKPGYNWVMVILPIFQPLDLKLLQEKLKFKFVDSEAELFKGFWPNDLALNPSYEAERPGGPQKPPRSAKWITDQIRRRVVNRLIYDDKKFWEVGNKNPYWPKGLAESAPGALPTQPWVDRLRQRYLAAIEDWEKALPTATGLGQNTVELVEDGSVLGEGLASISLDPARGQTGSVPLSETMEKLGNGIFVSITCSPYTNTFYETTTSNIVDSEPLAADLITRHAIVDYVHEVNAAALDRFDQIYGKQRRSARRRDQVSRQLDAGAGAILQVDPEKTAATVDTPFARPHPRLAYNRSAAQGFVAGGRRTRKRRRRRVRTRRRASQAPHRRTRRHRSKRRRRRRTRRRRAGGLTTRRCREKAKSIINRLLPSGLRLKTEQGKMVKLIAKDFECSTEEARRLLKDPAFVKDFALAGGHR